MSDTKGTAYRFAPLEESTLLAGLRGAQLLVLGGGSGAIVTAIRVGSPAVLGIGMVVFLGAVAIALGRFAGRNADVWARLLVAWASAWIGRRFIVNRKSGCAILPVHLFSITAGGHARPGHSQRAVISAPRPLARIRITSVKDQERHIGVVRDGSFPWFTAALRVHGRSFALLGAEEQQRRLAEWATILDGLAQPGSGVRRLQWIERAAPEQYRNGGMTPNPRHPSHGAPQGVNQGLAQGVTHAGSSRGLPDPFSSYAELLATAPAATQEHDVLLVVQIDASRRAGAGRVVTTQLLLRALRDLAVRLREADLEVTGALGPAALESAIAAAFSPFTQHAVTTKDGPHPNAAPAAGPWPSAASTQWSTYRTDDAWHATFWVAQWPQTAVGPDFLAPLLLHGRAARSVSVVCEPIDAEQGLHRAQVDRVNRLADERLREGRGFLTTARHQRHRSNALEREAQLTDGHTDVRFCGYITVSAPTRDQLEHDCVEMLQSARRARLQLRRLYGQQDLAFTYTLPLCRGLDV